MWGCGGGSWGGQEGALAAPPAAQMSPLLYRRPRQRARTSRRIPDVRRAGGGDCSECHSFALSEEERNAQKGACEVRAAAHLSSLLLRHCCSLLSLGLLLPPRYVCPAVPAPSYTPPGPLVPSRHRSRGRPLPARTRPLLPCRKSFRAPRRCLESAPECGTSACKFACFVSRASICTISLSVALPHPRLSSLSLFLMQTHTCASQGRRFTENLRFQE